MAHFDDRLRTATAIVIWSSLPFLASVAAALAGRFRTSAAFALLAIASLTAAVLARSRKTNHQLGSVALLAVVSLPFAAAIVTRFAYGFGPGVLAVADSPITFLMGTVLESLFAVPAAAFAIAVWRRRTRCAITPPPAAAPHAQGDVSSRASAAAKSHHR